MIIANVTFPYVELIAERGLTGACEAKPELKSGINVMDGQVTCQAVAESHGMDWIDPDKVPGPDS